MNQPSSSPSPSEPGRERAGDSWRATLVGLRWPLAFVIVAFFGLCIYLVTLWQAERAASAVGDLVGDAADRAESLARGFFTGDVTEAFVSSIPEIRGAEGGRLELATAEMTETFTRTDERKILWDQFSLGVTATEIKVPVTYRYHLRLADPWRLEVSGNTCVVHPPRIRPTQPPAIHTDRMEKRVEEGWLRFDAAEQLEALEKSITPRLIIRASGPQHLGLVREESRQAVAEFVRLWLLREDQWREDRLSAVTVIFPDEESRPREKPVVRMEADDG